MNSCEYVIFSLTMLAGISICIIKLIYVDVVDFFEVTQRKQVIGLLLIVRKKYVCVCVWVSVMNCLSIIVRVNYFVAPLGVSVCQEL